MRMGSTVDSALLEAIYFRVRSGDIIIEPFFGPNEKGMVLLHFYTKLPDGTRSGFDHHIQLHESTKGKW